MDRVRPWEKGTLHIEVSLENYRQCTDNIPTESVGLQNWCVYMGYNKYQLNTAVSFQTCHLTFNRSHPGVQAVSFI
jgi:hypothetical protein